MFAQSEPAVIVDELHAAHWRDVEVIPVTTTLRLGGDPFEAAQYLADSGPGRAVLETIDDPDRPVAVAAVVDALAAHQGDGGVGLGAAFFLIQARVESGQC